MVSRGTTQTTDMQRTDTLSDPFTGLPSGPAYKALSHVNNRLVARPDDSRAPKLTGVVAEYDTPEELVAACERVRDAGMTKWDSYTPYPIHGIERAMGIKATILPWIVLCGGLTGCATGILMQWYLNGSEELANEVGIPTALQGYNFLISGKPIWSLPANIPVAFELTILFSAFGAFFGMLALNRLPRLSNPRLRLPGFRRGTDDQFVIGLDAKDPKFDLAAAAELLSPTRPTAVREVWDVEPRRPPAWIPTVALILFALLLIPPVLIAEHRNTPWSTPRIHPVGDMDWQASFKPQQRNPFFPDQRAMRPQVEGTIARGELDLDDALFRGIDPTGGPAQASGPAPALPDGQDQRLASAALFAFASFRQDEAAEAGGENATGASPTDAPQEQTGDAPAATEGATEDKNYVSDLPIEPTLENVQRGQLVFNIYCAACHGVGGFGNGLVAQRAATLKQPTWAPPSNLHTDVVRNRPNGYLYDAIANGVRKMPAYGTQIEVRDRWNVVLYLRALQKSQAATLAEIPAADRARTEAEKAEADRIAAAQAAAEAARAESGGAAAPAVSQETDGGADDSIVPRGKSGGAPETSSSAAPTDPGNASPDMDGRNENPSPVAETPEEAAADKAKADEAAADEAGDTPADDSASD
ncbi:quinol:electron acceptor oxidoreductase subunit ActD [Alienimonas californiensis]|uniref:Cytochrome c n=1 Tax=Alienimonas californiensis TaxID=2527989 RepID=A0A517PBT6_9PLAN|nr:quinol:electron acceptor oxidoreductase subunit ActD [Alienimonas californiensis]QDT16845.1 Cytochrome c [Alienimonas californiensis]